MIDEIKRFLLELFFPSFCIGCSKEGSYVCLDCRSTLEISEYNYCLCSHNPLRLAPLAQAIGSESPQAQRGKLQSKCNRCRDKKLSGLYFALPYKEKSLTRKLIYNFKYEPYIKNLAKTLSSILIEHFVLSQSNTNQVWENGILIPIPLEKTKLKSRGYNQAHELAKELSKVINIPIESNVLLKTKVTKEQTNLSKEERERNLKNAFLVKNQELIHDKKVFLVDDVYTTGSTMEECTHILCESGAHSVWGISIARDN